MPTASKWLQWMPAESDKADRTDETISDGEPQGASVSSVSFVNGGRCVSKPRILSDTAEHWSDTHDAQEWSPDFASWARIACVLDDRCTSGIGALHISFSEWCVANKSVPCTRPVFERLLVEEEFRLCDGFVAGLVLKEDLAAMTDRRTVESGTAGAKKSETAQVEAA